MPEARASTRRSSGREGIRCVRRRLLQLHAVLEQTQHAVVVRERRRLGAADVALVRRARRARRSVPRWRMRSSESPCTSWSSCTVNSMSRMPPGPSFSWYGTSAGRDVLGDALAHALHAVDEVLACGARPDLGLHGAHVRLAELGVTGDRARLQERLELPALRPAVVVRQVRVERAHQRALLALRPQIRIDLPQRRLDLDARDAAHRLHGEAGRDVDDPALADGLEQRRRPRPRRRSRRRRSRSSARARRSCPCR